MNKKYTISSPQNAAKTISDYRLSGNYNWAYRHRYDVVSHFLPRTTDTPQDLLDFGCGDGMFLRYLYEHSYGLNLTGYDPFCPNEKTNNAMGNIEIFNKIEEVKGEKFHFVTALDVIEHIEDDETALVQINNLLKPRGTCILTLPAYKFLYSDYDAMIGHYRRYTKQSITALLQKTQFSVQHVSYFFTFLIPPFILLKYYLRLRKVRKEKPLLTPHAFVTNIFEVLASVEYLGLRLTNFSFPVGQTLLVIARKDI